MALVHLVLLAATAAAQDPSGWVVAVASTGDGSGAARRAATRATEHLESEGQRVLSGPSLDERVATTISRPFVAATQSEQSHLTTLADAVTQQVTYGDDDGAQRAVTAAIAEA